MVDRPKRHSQRARRATAPAKRARTHVHLLVLSLGKMAAEPSPKKAKEAQNSDYSHLLPPHYRELVRSWLQEDLPSFDYGGYVVGSRHREAVLLCKSPGVLCGVPFFTAVFEELGCTVEWGYQEGSVLEPVCEVARVSGPVNRVLQGERTALNVLTRASGVATHARDLAKEAERVGWEGEVAGTRKTTPGFRLVEKYSLVVGGVSTHRYDLSQMVMLKDNHIWSTGSISLAVGRARSVAGFSVKIEVECRSVAEAREAARAGAEVVMLDNFDPSALAVAAKTLKSEFPHLTIEASGGIRRETLAQFCLPEVDVVSLSTTTQGYSPVNFSLKVCVEGRDPRNPKVTLNDV